MLEATRAPAAAKGAVCAATASNTVRAYPDDWIRPAIPAPIRPRPMKPTFIGDSPDGWGGWGRASRGEAGNSSVSLPALPALPALDQLTLHPLELPGDVLDDVAGLQVIGEHIPRVSLDLEVRRERRLLVDRERLLEAEARGAEPVAQLGQ